MSTPTTGKPRKLLAGSDLLALLALLGAIAVVTPKVVRHQQQLAQQQDLIACTSNENNIGTALEMYSTDNSGRYPLTLGALTPRYLHVLPTCPAAGSETYSVTFQSASFPDAYTFFCKGLHHPLVGPDLPVYPSNGPFLSGH